MEATYERKADGSYHRSGISKHDRDERCWHKAKDPTVPLWSTVRTLQSKQSWRRQSDDLAMHLYSDMRYVGYRVNAGRASYDDVVGSRLGDNVIRSIVRALNAKIARRRSRPYLVTNGANFQQRLTAENLERWLVGKLRQQKADSEVFPLYRLHTLTFGTGCLRIYDGGDKGACLEVIPSTEIMFDDAEARYGAPRTIYFVRVANREVLESSYPDKKEVFDKLSGSLGVDEEWGAQLGAWDRDSETDLCVTIEAIHLPSVPGAGDGRHVISVQSGVLLDEEWEEDHFFCAWMRRELRPMGFWGIGVPEDLASTQIEISQTQEARSEMIDMFARPYWVIERGMKMMRSAISNLMGRVMEYTNTGSGKEPRLVTPQAVPTDLWRHGDELKRSAFETEGVSQLAAQMLKPQGLNSGKALRAFHEMEAELLSDLMNASDESLLKTCELLIEMQMKIAKDPDRADQAVTYVGDGEIEQINWKDVGLKDDLANYVIEIMPASALASTLSARIEDVMDLRDLGAITDPNEVWEFIDMPDRRRQKRKHLSGEKLLDKIIEVNIIHKGKAVMPEPSWNLERAKEKALDAIQELELYEDAPEDRLTLLREFIVNCKMVQQYGLVPPSAAGLAGMENLDAASNLAGTDLAAGGGNPELGAAAGLPGGAPDLGAAGGGGLGTAGGGPETLPGGLPIGATPVLGPPGAGQVGPAAPIGV